MKIVNVSVVAFGKLQSVNLSFNSGVNVLQNKNAFGKTTFAAFVRAMLYGLNYSYTKEGDERVNDVTRYCPWGFGGKFGGSMTVEHNGATYRIERFFGGTARAEVLSVTNESTGAAVDVSGGVGEYFLGLTADSYDRSTYFPQEAVELATNENLDGRLANLVDSADYDKVQEKLLAYRRQKRAGRGVGGTIAQLDNEIFDLQRKLHEAELAENMQARNAEQHSANEAQLQQLNARKCDIQRQLEEVKRNIVLNSPTEEQLAAKQRLMDAKLALTKYPQDLVADRQRVVALGDRIAQTPRHPNVQKASPKWWLVVLAAVLILGGAGLCFAGKIPLLIGGGILVVVGAALLAVALLSARNKGVETLQSTEWDELVTDYMRIVGKYVDVAGKDYEEAARLFWQYFADYERDCRVYQTVESLTPSMPNGDVAALNARERELTSQLAAVTSEIQRIYRMQGSLENAVQNAQVADRAEIEDKILNAQQAKAVEEQKFATAERVSALLTQAKENLSGGYLPKLKTRVSQLVDFVTNGQYEVSLDGKFAIRIRENGQTKQLSCFSRGVREIVLLCFRVALSELLYDGAVPLVVVDDAFVNYDEDNFVRATALLKELATKCGTQVIYFTCHNRLGALT